MPLSFPLGPSGGQTYVGPNGVTYTYNSTLGAWTASAGGGGTTLTSALGINITGALVKVSIPTLPAAPAAGALANEAIDGSLYWDVNTGALFIRYNDGSLTSWIQTVPSGGGGGSSVTAASLVEAAAGTINTKFLSPETGVPKNAAGMTGAAIIPGGDDAERLAIAPVTGMLRYNDQTLPAVMEYYDGSNWVDLATAAGPVFDSLRWFGHMIRPSI